MVRYKLAICLLTTACYIAAENGSHELKSLFESRRWFDLRDAIESADTPTFYRVVVSCVFDDVRQAEKQFRQLAKSGPRSAETFEAHGMLASAHMRAQHYRQALSHLQAMQAVRPDYGGLSGAVKLLAALSQHPQPALARRRFSEVHLTEDMFIPLSANGKPANYGFDTGMDLSVMSESEAIRIGAAVREVPGSEFQDGASGIKVSTRFIIVDRIVLGGFELKNVVFLVVRNDAMPFAELPAEKQGILGFPVLRAFETMRWDRNGILQIAFRSDPKSRKPNLCMPGNSSPVVEGLFGSKRITVLLDSGSGRTVLTPRFMKDFPALIEQNRNTESTLLRGLGGSKEVDVVLLPEFKFRAGNFEFLLKPAQVLPQDPAVERNSYHVWCGMDMLGQARRVTFDFLSMRFEVE